MSARDEAEDGVRLRDLQVAVDQEGEVGKVQPDGPSELRPAGPVVLRRRAATKAVVFILSSGVLEEHPDWFGQLYNAIRADSGKQIISYAATHIPLCSPNSKGQLWPSPFLVCPVKVVPNN